MQKKNNNKIKNLKIVLINEILGEQFQVPKSFASSSKWLK